MKDYDNLIKAYAGNEAAVLLLKARLEEAGISALVKNDYSAAWYLAVPPAIDLYIEESDLKEAEPIIKDFLKDNP
ncbi:MAG TPA: DUF2007 domain-containing protein [Chitinophagaceae bacterium]